MNLKRLTIAFALTAFMVAGFAVDGQCHAKAKVKKGSCYVEAKAGCKGTGGGDNEQATQSGCPSEVNASAYCTSSGASAYAYANKSGSSKYTKTRTHSWRTKGRSSAGKGLEMADAIYIANDTTELTIDSLLAGAQLNLKGKMRAMSNTRVGLNIVVYQNDDSLDVIFTGTVELNGGSKEMQVTGFSPEDFAKSTIGDTVILTYDFAKAGLITYQGTYEELGVELIADPEAHEVPSLTQYGLIALLALLLITGIYVYRRKRLMAA